MSKHLYLLFLVVIIPIYSKPNCEEGKNNCLNCNPVTKLCYKCTKDIYAPNEDGGCDNAKKCTIGNNYCSKCNEEESLCEECDGGFYPDENGGCSSVPNCEVSYKGECLKCSEGYILVGDSNIKICKSLNSDDLKNCDIINETNGNCIKCIEKYFLNAGDKKCSLTENCYESSFGICKSCIENYYLNNKESTCKTKSDNLQMSHCKETMDEENCEKCDENYYLDEYGKCVDTNYCKKGNNLFMCERCVSGYYTSTINNTCTTEKNCYEGNRDLGICTLCSFEYFIDFADGKCKSNLEYNEFKYCRKVDNDKCVECRIDYYLGQDNKCSSSRYCVESDLGVCLECEEGYWLGKDKKCTNIEKCIATNAYNDECEECEDGYYYSKTDKICKSSEGIFENCKSAYDHNYCIDCKDNYYLKKKEYVCLSNEEKGKFYKCAESSFYGDMCVKCVKNYFLGLDYQCSNIDGCVFSENNEICNECSRNYCLDLSLNKCIDNKKITDEEKEFYYKCKKTDEEGNKCESCINGYWLNEKGLCVNDKGCKEMDEKENKCISCNENFCLNEDFECVETTTNNCLECGNKSDFNQCTKCEKGYILDEDNICVESD